MTEGAAAEAGSGRRFRPTLWSSLAAFVGVAALLMLGTWQVQRLHWKEALIERLSARMEAPAVNLPGELDDPDELAFRRYRATGRYRHDHELFLGSKTYNGQVGFRVVTPFDLADGRLILVDRGWIPVDRQDPASRQQGQLAGVVTLEGFARKDGWTGSTWFRPDNEPDRNYWFWVDLDAMARAIEAPALVRDVYLQAVAGEVPGGLPRGRPDGVTVRNDHLQYAMTWYALAAALLVIYVLFSLRPTGRIRTDRPRN